jgi:ribulose-phosphate 3-epimerase
VTRECQAFRANCHKRPHPKMAAVSWDRWIRTVEVEPSLYAADFSRLGDQIETLLGAGARVFHFDVGDAHFVEPVTMGPIVLESIAPHIHRGGGGVDCHLMVDDPAHHFDALRSAGADSVTFHVEAADDPPAVAAKARERGLQVGLAFNPETTVEEAVAASDGFDLVLCMSIHPGYSGQEFLPEAVGRLQELRAALPDGVHVQVDGGITEENIRAVREAGADLIVCGASLFGTEDLTGTYGRLTQLVT